MADIIERMKNGERIIIGMVHCLPLPGTFKYGNDIGSIIKKAVSDAITLEKGGVDAIIVENTCDQPSAEKLDISQIAALSVICAKVRESVKLSMGIDAAFNDFKAAFSIALASDGCFIRIPVFVDTVVSGAGIIGPCNREAVLYRRSLGAEHIKIFADVQVKHSYMLSSQIPIEESAKWAQGRGADAIIVTGSTTGAETSMDQLKRVTESVSIPVVVGSGICQQNIKKQLGLASGAIVGTAFKKGGIVENPVEYELTRALTANK